MKVLAMQPGRHYIVIECDGDGPGLGRILSMESDNITGQLGPPEFYPTLSKGGYWEGLERPLTVDAAQLNLERSEWPEPYATMVAEDAKRFLAAMVAEAAKRSLATME